MLTARDEILLVDKFAGQVVLAACAVFLAVAIFQACTVTPRTVKDSGASFDANDRNSGLIGFDAAGNGIITPQAKARYDDLVNQYQKWFHPPIGIGFGATKTDTNTWLLTREALVDFGVMTKWQKQGLKPHN